MKLDPASGVNDFINARTEKQCLSPLSTIIHQKAFPKTQVTDAFRQRYYADTMQELNSKIAELDSLPLETMEKQESMIKGKIETIRTRTKNKELISFVEACSVHVNDIVDAAKQRFAEEKKQLEVEKELAEAQNKANAQREAYANGLSVFVASCKSSGNLASKLEDWKKIAKQNAGNDNFTEDELATIEQALSAIYSVTTDKKTLNKWKIGKGDFFKRMVKVLGNKQITEELFKRIMQ